MITRDNCEIFDGSQTRQIASTNYLHRKSNMALYNGQPIIVAGYPVGGARAQNASKNSHGF